MNKVLVIAVHPDDETLGCGGTLLKHKANGDQIHWGICTETSPGSDFFKAREKEIQKVSEMYKFDSTSTLGLQAIKVDEYTMSDLVSRFSELINRIKPDILYIPFANDVHSDHRKIFEAVYSCTKSFRYPFIKEILMMEVLSETEFAVSIPSQTFVPNLFVDITEYRDKKNKIMSVFQSEMADHPFPRSFECMDALARFRGATINRQFAESFMTLKIIR